MGFTRKETDGSRQGTAPARKALRQNLGLLQSTDSGVTWEPVALPGEVDFHRLVAADDRLFGIASAENALLRSDDGGSTWITAGTPPLFDIAVNPANPDTLIGTTATGRSRTTDPRSSLARADADRPSRMDGRRTCRCGQPMGMY